MPNRFARLFLVAFGSVLAASAQTEPRVVRYTPTQADLKYTFGPAAPVARLRPGDIFETNTWDAFGNALQKPGDTLSMVKGDNPLTGPFYIEGAQPGDTLAVTILDLQLDSDQGVGALGAGFGALNSSFYTPMLHPPLPERIWFYPVDRAAGTATFRALDSKFEVKFPLHPFFGCFGVAPPSGEARSSITPGEWGGNMDAPEVRAGNTIYLPVSVPGALLYLGDAHAAMGDGEVAGTGIEIPARTHLRVEVLKGQKINWPRFSNREEIMTVGATRPLDDALRVAFTELVAWIHKDYGLSELDAYELLTKVGRIHLTEMVDPNYVIVASIARKYLPPPRPAAR